MAKTLSKVPLQNKDGVQQAADAFDHLLAAPYEITRETEVCLLFFYRIQQELDRPT